MKKNEREKNVKVTRHKCLNKGKNREWVHFWDGRYVHTYIHQNYYLNLRWEFIKENKKVRK